MNKKIKIKLKTDLNKLRNKADGVIVGWFYCNLFCATNRGGITHTEVAIAITALRDSHILLLIIAYFVCPIL